MSYDNDYDIANTTKAIQNTTTHALLFVEPGGIIEPLWFGIFILSIILLIIFMFIMIRKVFGKDIIDIIDRMKSKKNYLNKKLHHHQHQNSLDDHKDYHRKSTIDIHASNKHKHSSHYDIHDSEYSSRAAYANAVNAYQKNSMDAPSATSKQSIPNFNLKTISFSNNFLKRSLLEKDSELNKLTYWKNVNELNVMMNNIRRKSEELVLSGDIKI